MKSGRTLAGRTLAPNALTLTAASTQHNYDDSLDYVSHLKRLGAHDTKNAFVPIYTSSVNLKQDHNIGRVG